MSEQLRLQFPDLPETGSKSDLLDLIPYGERNAVSMKALASLLRTDCRAIRQKILDARLKGSIICSSVYGYFQPVTHEELKRYVSMVRSAERSKYRSLLSAEHALDRHIYPSEESEGVVLNE